MVILLCSNMYFSMTKEDCESYVVGVFKDRQDLYHYLDKEGVDESFFDQDKYYGDEPMSDDYCWYHVEEVDYNE